jgi:ATP-binding cassette subfamily G (WHITE) protein 2 (PDR)
MGVLCFFCWYYPIGLQQNGVDAGNLHGRGACAFLFVWVFLVFTSTFGHMVIAAFETADAAAAINNAFFILMFAFAGYVPTTTLTT